MSKWSDYYKDRVNSGYQKYFEERYKPMLNILKSYTSVCEEGIGIGSISKALRKNDIKCSGIDNDRDIIKLCLLNNPGLDVLYGDIFFYINQLSEVTCTHGVLEHLDDIQIFMVLDKYRRNNIFSIHYVPTDQYSTPSFGDERLLPKEYWIRTFKPTTHYSFNQNKDLLLMF